MADRADTKALLLQVDASVELLRSGMAKGDGILTKFDKDAQRTLDRFDGRMKRVGAQGMPELSKGLNLAKASLLGLAAGFGALGAAGAARTFIEYADQAKLMRSQLVLATADLGGFGQAQDDVKRIAAETRVGLDATTKLYGNMLRASAGLGGTQEQAARATETFTKALKIGGAGAQEAASATLQFGQALASGALRGDEFNSIAEASPRILRLLADSMGVPQGKLRALAAEGKLTSDILYRALTDPKFTAGIDGEFRELPVTFDEAMTTIRDSAVLTFGAFDRGGQFSTALVNFITDGANGFQSMEDKAEAFGVSARGTIEGLGSAFGPLLDAGIAAFDTLGIRIDQFSLDGRKEIQSLLSSLDDLDKMFGFENYSAFGVKVSGVGQRYADATAQSDRTRKGELAEGRFRDMNRGFDIMGNSTRRPPFPAATPSSASPSRRSSSKVRQITDEDRASNFDAASRAANERFMRAQSDISQSAERRAQIAVDMLRLDHEEYAADQAAKVKKKQLTQAQADQLIATNAATRDLEQQKVVQQEQSRVIRERLSLDQDTSRAALDMLDIQSQLATTAASRRDVELRILALQEAMERKVQQAILDDPTSNPAQRRQATAEMDGINAKGGGRREIINRQTAGPLEQYRQSIPKTADEVNEALEGIQVAGLQSLNDGITDAIMGAQSLGDMFKNVANQIISDLIRVAVQQTIVNQLIGGVGGLFGGLFGGGSIVMGGAANKLGLFSSGGYTGNAPKDQIAGAVHGQEFVFDAAATQRIGVSNLEAMRAGTFRPPSVSQSNIRGSGGASSPPAFVRIEVAEGAMFAPRVAKIAGDVSAQITQAAAPLTAGAAAEQATSSISRRARRSIP